MKDLNLINKLNSISNVTSNDFLRRSFSDRRRG